MKTKPNPRIIPVGIAEVLAEFEFQRAELRLSENMKPARIIRMNFGMAASDATIDEILDYEGT